MRTKTFIIFGFLLISLNFNFSYGLSCKTNQDCNNGVCKNESCTCVTGYVDYYNAPCSYKQKEKTTAYWLSLLLGFLGADWFYLSNGNGGYIAAGIFKLLFGIFGNIFPCVLLVEAKIKKKQLSRKMGLIVCSFAITIIIWCVVDLIRIRVNKFNDGNGIPLKVW